MNGRAQLVSIISTSVALLVIASYAFGLILPDSFYGAVLVNGDPAPAGTQIRGMIGGIDKTFEPPYLTSSSGSYGSATISGQFRVQGDTSGQTILFEVKTPSMSDFVAAAQTGATFGGGRKNINLTVNFSIQCTNEQTRQCGTTDVGVCEFGTQTCVVGQWSACENNIEPVEETCNSIDDDCDGSTDETFVNLNDACSSGVGACQAVGTFVCSEDGSTTVCTAQPGQPSAELCGDNVDNNCNGQVDEGFNVGEACSAGVGACTAEGFFICNEAGTGTTCNAVAGQPQTEVCDNLDNDCDGTIDEQLVQQCGSTDVGACEFGTQTCFSGAWSTCENNIEPVSETCNSVDDDCDGLTDETFENLNDACSSGVGACQASGIFVCSEDGSTTVCTAIAGEPSAELCGDNVDNNCNGQTDEGFNVGEACSAGVGACTAEGMFVCSEDGLSTTCNAQPSQPSAEICDSIDNDCDGSTDEIFNVGDSCTAGSGACQVSGTFVCSQDGSTTVCNAQPGDGSAEVCDNIDNDCDGITDEQLVQQCGSTDVGACEFGTQTCNVGSWSVCENNIEPVAETCNSMDDDCDGSTDEGFNVGASCSAGTGVCESAGTFVCNDIGDGTVCNAVAGQPQTEVCDNLDDDCDGQADELGTQTCGVGACQNTVNVCINGNDNACVPLDPSSEVCNDQIDNDCDGLADSLDSDCQCVNNQTLSATTNNNIYEVDSTVIISGMLDIACGSEANKQVGIVVKGPIGNVIFTTQQATSSDGSYSTSLSLENAEVGEYEVQSAFNGSSATKKFTVIQADDEDFCIIIANVQILNSTFNETASVGKGKFYNVKVSNTNVCSDPVETMQIVQIMKGTLPINLGTVTSTIAPGTTSYITLGFTMPQSADTGAYNANAFNWNHWIDQDPSSFKILSKSITKEFQVT